MCSSPPCKVAEQSVNSDNVGDFELPVRVPCSQSTDRLHGGLIFLHGLHAVSQQVGCMGL